MADWTTADVAHELAMSEDWVREHAPELGGYRVGGPRSPLRFEPGEIAAYKQRQRLARPRARRNPHRPGPPSAPRGVKLVPLPSAR